MSLLLGYSIFFVLLLLQLLDKSKKKHTNTYNDSHRQNYEYFKIKVKINQESWHDVIHYVVTHPRTNNTEKRANKIRLLKKKDNG
jgi:hypothetical protein